MEFFSLLNQKKSGFSYIPELDGIRGLAILAVMIFHTGIPWFKGGFIGVDIFFVLSGFLITSLLIKEYDKNRRISLKHFYIRRILRLAPALFILLLSVAIFSIFVFSDRLNENLESILISLFYSANWARAFDLHNMGLLSHTWSLSIEEQFYIMWPVLLILLLRFIKSRKTIALIAALFVSASWLLRIILLLKGYAVQRIYNGLDTRADALLTGCILAILLSSNLINVKGRKVQLIIRNFAALALFSYLIILFSISWRNPHNYYWLGFALQVLTAFLILHAVSSDRTYLKNFLSGKLIAWIGSISYGLYLWHDPVYETMRIFGCSKFTIATLGTIITFSIASLSYYMAERPILKLKEKFASAGHPEAKHQTGITEIEPS